MWVLKELDNLSRRGVHVNVAFPSAACSPPHPQAADPRDEVIRRQGEEIRHQGGQIRALRAAAAAAAEESTRRERAAAAAAAAAAVEEAVRREKETAAAAICREKDAAAEEATRRERAAATASIQAERAKTAALQVRWGKGGGRDEARPNAHAALPSPPTAQARITALEVRRTIRGEAGIHSQLLISFPPITPG